MDNLIDECHAFVPDEIFRLLPNKAGRLSSLTFAVKELFNVKGYITGSGNTHWKLTHDVAEQTAPSIVTLLNDGATMLGKTISDEMAFSMDGENVHYGTPQNPKCKNRIPGGSSSGSASAVAGGLVDFALGTDTAGSVRVPASYCGIYGFRPTHGLISTVGIHPLAPSFDVVGWFAKSLDILTKVGMALLDLEIENHEVSELAIPISLINQLDPEVRSIFIEYIDSLSFDIIELDLAGREISEWIEILRNIQCWELNEMHGKWIKENMDTFGEEIRGRLENISSVTRSDMEKNRDIRFHLMEYIDNLISKHRFVIFPTVHDIAPLKGRSIIEARAFRANVMKHTCFATVAGLPQISLPLLGRNSCPIGVSLLGSRGNDALIFGVARKLVD